MQNGTAVVHFPSWEVVMMRRFSFLLCVLYFPSIVNAQLVLNEVYYDHPGLDTGHEFIELINLGSVTASLAGYTLEFHDGNGSGWKVIWRAAPVDSVGGSGLFVVGGDLVTPPVDTAIALVLQNGPDAVRLARNGTGVDRLAYGGLVDPLYVETASAPDAPAGFGLSRWPDGKDSDDNAADFRVLEPSPGRFNQPRHDLALLVGRDTGLRKLLPAGGADVIVLQLHNRGVELVAAAVTIQLVDSAQSALPFDGWEAPGPLAPGDSVEVAFAAAFGPGYHTVTATAVYAADERPADNRLQLLRRVGSPPVLISEVMSHPAAGCPEYVELYNVGTLPYDIGGHSLRDRVSAPAAIDTVSTVIAPGRLVVITADAAALRSWFPGLTDEDVTEVTGGWPSLNHTSRGSEADSVIFFDRFHLAIDRVAYPAQPADSRGRSLERVDLYPGQGVHVWALAAPARGGSPARPNPSGIEQRPRGATIALSSNPYDPAEPVPLLITVPARAGPAGAIVHLFDTRGRRVRDIGATTQLPFVFTWDGTDDRGRAVTPGLYVIACEYVTGSGGRGRVEKVVLGCARRIR
ncbi:MAG: lamin tail domain-containing protein [Candidatus Krumholzibacteriia bacterium]